jgi:hypothetical protein
MTFDHGVLTCSKVDDGTSAQKEEKGTTKGETGAAKKLYFVVADLHAKKDTVRILTDLQKSFQVVDADSSHVVTTTCSNGENGATHYSAEKDVVRKQRAAGREFLGKTSLLLSRQAQVAVANKDAEMLGRLMHECQSAFHAALQPLCPSQLTSPKLYKVLHHPAVQPLVYGGKGVGSQGDGTVQFVAKSLEAQSQLVALLGTPDLDCSPYPLTL